MQKIRTYLLVFLYVVVCNVPIHASDDFRILFLTDVHVTPGNRHDQEFPKIIEEINKEKDSYAFCIVTGDLTNHGSDEELHNFKKKLDDIQMKSYVIPGNHESTWSENACQTIDKIWGSDRFEFKYGNYYCIAFSTGPYMKMGHGFVKAEDLHWLNRKLKENASDPETKVLVFSHYPLKTGLANWPDVTAILKNYNVIATFCGHEHQLKKMNFDGIPGFMGRPLLFGMNEPPGYNIIEIQGDQLAVIPRKLGEPEGEPFVKFKMGDPSIIADVACDPLPETVRGEIPENIKLTLVREDDATIFGGIALLGNKVFYGNSLGTMKACEYDPEKKEGEQLNDLWTKQYAHSIYSTPVASDGILVFGSPDREIAALDAENGEKIWSIVTHAPITNDGTLLDGAFYSGLAREEFCKIDLKTGEKLWSYKGVDGRFQAAPTIAYGTVVFGAWNEHLYALDEKTGKELWTWSGGRRGVLYSPGNVTPVISDTHIIVVAPDRYMTAINRKTGEQVWRNNDFTVREAMGTSPDGSIAYAKTMNGHVIAVSATSDEFELLWDAETGVEYDHVASPLLVHDQKLYYGSPDGEIAVFNAETGERLMFYKCGNSGVNRFVPDAKGRIWFTMIDGKIWTLSHL